MKVMRALVFADAGHGESLGKEGWQTGKEEHFTEKHEAMK